MSKLSATAAARELTVLAWRRTLLRWAVVVVVAARVFTAEFGVVVVASALVVLAVAGLINLAVSREFSNIATDSDVAAPRLPQPLRRPSVRLAALFTGTLVVCVLALAWVVVG